MEHKGIILIEIKFINYCNVNLVTVPPWEILGGGYGDEVSAI